VKTFKKKLNILAWDIGEMGSSQFQKGLHLAKLRHTLTELTLLLEMERKK
jgi:hypothetical protein